MDELSLAIHLVHLQDGRSSGEAFVEFESAKDLEKAMTFNKKHLGTRYINSWWWFSRRVLVVARRVFVVVVVVWSID